MRTLATLVSQLVLPVIGAPMRKVSGPDLVIAQCRAGILGTFPVLNARPQQELGRWIEHIKQALKASDTRTPFGVNLALHPSNIRRQADLAACVTHEVPVVISCMHPPHRIVAQIHDYGGLVLHEVTTVRHAQKAIEAGVDGLILVAGGAGGNAGDTNPFAFVNEVRAFHDGPLALAGCIGHGKDILAAQAMGCMLSCVGTRFIATQESLAPDRYRRMVMDADLSDIVATACISGLPGNYLAPSLAAAGMDVSLLRHALPAEPLDLAHGAIVQATRDVWSAGQGVGLVQEELSVASLVSQLTDEYQAARRALAPAY